jgi:hypothetical protein
MQNDQLTAVLAALLIGSRRQDLTPEQAVEMAEAIQRTIENNTRAANLALIEGTKTDMQKLRQQLNPDQQ